MNWFKVMNLYIVITLYIVAILQHFLNTFVEAMNEDEKSLKCLIH